MLSLGLGLIAALAWAVHDICVRFVSQRGGILPALCAVLIVGTLLMAPASMLSDDWGQMTARAYMLAMLSGAIFTLGYVGLYNAFRIGPVRLVAPIIGAYPVLTIAYAVLAGQAVPPDHWIAVGAVIVGVGIVGMLSDETDSGGSKRSAILWALMGGAGFALTFAIGQSASHAGADMPVILITRLSAVALAVFLLFATGRATLPQRSAWPFLALMGLLDCIALGVVIAASGFDRPEFASVAASTFGMLTVV
ncbi:EamA family transporter, partial [Rhodobacteraceae bacterium KMM 6894]|nr:EamA family transporter [Rhodobacteraceae bacterium KMM 6894]